MFDKMPIPVNGGEPEVFVLAEREGFEPSIRKITVCLISSQVHSTTLPSFRLSLILTID